ncbi:hypothetical protein B0H16DRAFT_1741877 [Mycena metata]|uniref:BHLH domain-containing protein n=1 Tax=Mycena metata TaxID=1033252 RepID=A0AAD7MGA2_9AGAR|nr:hypothetical protein B0H16DRAFT_1741877 [Mycena metata]
MRVASVDTGYFASTDDPATELANRVRKNASLVLAAQIGSDSQYQPHQPSAFTAPPAPSYPTPNTAASAFTTAPVRRYRTNLNAHIQSLRQVVPALRIVDRAAAIKAGEPYPGGDASDPEDHIDARGFKIARKCSKANVFGKAVKYIRMLKNPENRLTHELEGLKTVLRGLVGGMELLGSGSMRSKRKRKKVEVKVEHKPAAAPVQEKKMCGRPTKVVPLYASDCVHKPAVSNVRVVSAGRRGIALSPSFSFPPSFPMLSVPLFPTLLFPSDPRHRVTAAHLRRRVERSTGDAYAACTPCALRSSPPPLSSPPSPFLPHTIHLVPRPRVECSSQSAVMRRMRTRMSVCVRVEFCAHALRGRAPAVLHPPPPSLSSFPSPSLPF